MMNIIINIDGNYEKHENNSFSFVQPEICAIASPCRIWELCVRGLFFNVF